MSTFDAFEQRPAPDWVGWCHHCGVWQRGADARYLPQRWHYGFSAWVCVNCDDEPWGYGVWLCRCAECGNDAEYWDSEPCWKLLYGSCADARCERYDPCEVHPTI